MAGIGSGYPWHSPLLPGAGEEESGGGVTHTISPTGIASTVAMGSPTVLKPIEINPVGIPPRQRAHVIDLRTWQGVEHQTVFIG